MKNVTETGSDFAKKKLLKGTSASYNFFLKNVM